MKARALAAFTALATLAMLLSCASCTKENLLIVTNGAAQACDVIEVITDSGVVRGVCLAVDALARLFDELLMAQRLGIGVVLVVRAPEGGEERLTIAPEGVKALAVRVGAVMAKVKR